MMSEISWGNGIPLACSKLGGVPGIFIFTFCLLESSRVVSCLGRLLYEIGVCIEVYHSFGGEIVSVSVESSMMEY